MGFSDTNSTVDIMSNKTASDEATKSDEPMKISYKKLKWGLGACVGLYLLSLSLSIAVSFLSLKATRQMYIGPGNILVNEYDGSPVRAEEHLDFAPLTAIPQLPIESFQKLTSVLLTIDPEGEIKRLYAVDGFEKTANGTNIFLALGDRLEIRDGIAELLDRNGVALQSYDFELAKRGDLSELTNDTAQYPISRATIELLKLSGSGLSYQLG